MQKHRKQVREIPANPFLQNQNRGKRLRVAAYCRVSTEILFLKKRREQAEKAAQRSQAQQCKREELRRLLEEQELNLTQYEDTLTFRIVERVTVVSREDVRIRFGGGVEKGASLHG